MPRYDLIVIGGGAAGIIAAWRAASLGARVALLEKTVRLGTKIMISGGGKCNITHSGRVDEVLRVFRPNEARFLKPSMYRFQNGDILEMLTSRGLEVMTRPDGRVFPVDRTAKDVLAILRSYLDEAAVDVFLEAPVARVVTDGACVTGVELGSAYREPAVRGPLKTGASASKLLRAVHAAGEEASGARPTSSRFSSSRVVIAAGGSSYPASGTTGDGFSWARELGHSIRPIAPALAPVYMQWSVAAMNELAGVALADIELFALSGGTRIAKWRGDLLFTHKGVSGPAALGISREVAERLSAGCALAIDLWPDYRPEQLEERLLELARSAPKKGVERFSRDELPDRIVPMILADCGVPSGRIFAELGRGERKELVATLKGWILGNVADVPLDKGEVVAGGVALEEVDPQSMRSKLVDGLFLAGEVLDIAGPVGGYNLQAAFSTGYAAGESAVR